MADPLLGALHAIGKACPTLDTWAIADALWLGATAAGPPERVEERGTAAPGAHPRGEPSEPSESGPPGGRGEPVPAAPASGVFERLPASAQPVLGRAVTVGRARPLTNALAVGRALQPFMRRWPHGIRTRLDVEATVDDYARSGVLIPVLAPNPERWFDVILMVDTATSMAVWQAEVRALTTLLRGMGAFGDVREWRINPSTLVITDNCGREIDAAVRSAGMPGTRTVVLVLSDFAAAGWRASSPWSLVRALGTANPTLLINPLPPRLWRHTGLDHPIVKVRTRTPGVHSTGLDCRIPLPLRALGQPDGYWLPIPVAEFNARGLGRWARALMRTEPGGCDAILIPAAGRDHDADDTVTLSVADLVTAFLSTATPAAAQLAVVCSTFDHLGLPLLQLVRQAAVPEAEVVDVAEFLLSGLLTADHPDPGYPVLSYRAGAAEALQDHLTYHDAWHTFNAITRHIAENPTTGTNGVSAVIADPESGASMPAEPHPFAAAADALRRVLGIEDIPASTAAPVIVTEPSADEERLEDVLAEFDELVELDSVKQQIMALLRVDLRRAYRTAKPAPPKLIFIGAEADEEFMVARLLGRLLRATGILGNGHVVPVGPADLVLRSVVEIRERVRQALDGVLLVKTPRHMDDDAINELTNQMAISGDRLAVVLGGYPKLEASAGLRSYFDDVVPFPYYAFADPRRDPAQSDDATLRLLIRELKILRKGRAMFVRQIDERVGPVLRGMCGISDTDEPAEIRAKVAERLEVLAAALPEDLQIAFLAAFAISPDARLPFYQDRVRWIAQRLNRDDRTARRRIDEAIDRAAESAIKASETEPGLYLGSATDWYTKELKVSLSLDQPVPEAWEIRRIVANRDRLTRVEMALTQSARADAAALSGSDPIDVDVIYGGRLVRKKLEPGNRIAFTLEMPAPMRRFSEHEFAVRFRASREPIRQHYICVPQHRCEVFDLRVRFDLGQIPAQIWRLADAFQRDVEGPISVGDLLVPDSSGEIHTTFRRLTPGLAYGLRWSD